MFTNIRLFSKHYKLAPEMLLFLSLWLSAVTNVYSAEECQMRDVRTGPTDHWPTVANAEACKGKCQQI